MCPYILCTERRSRLSRDIRVNVAQQCGARQVQEGARRSRGKVAKVVVVEGGDGEGRGAVRASIFLVLLGLGFRFELVENGGETEPLRSEVEPAAFPEKLVPGDPVRCSASSGISRNVWDRQVCQHKHM